MMVRLPFLTCATLGVAALAGLAACGGSSSNPRSPGSCGAPTGQVALSYPAPGSTGIPDNIQGVIFASSSGLPGSYDAVIVPAGSSAGQTFQTVATAPSPLPSPYATPVANAIYQESASGGVILPAATQVSVYLNDLNSSCVPSLQGTFTTQ